jgi:hypothetical protein
VLVERRGDSPGSGSYGVALVDEEAVFLGSEFSNKLARTDVLHISLILIIGDVLRLLRTT